MDTVTFNLPFVAACISIIGAIILVVVTRRAEWWRRISMILLCCGFVASGVSTLIGLKGTDSALMHGATLGFTVSAVLVLALWHFAPSNNRWRGP
jgi:hypothetical protein